jgi:hypothetical protein
VDSKNPERALGDLRGGFAFTALLSTPNVMLIALPDSADADAIYTDYSRADAALTEQAILAGQLAPGAVMRGEITYPDLRIDQIPDRVRILLTAIQTEQGIAIRTEDAIYSKIARVYVCWRGVLRYYHKASGIDLLTLDQLATMEEGQAAQMRLGAPYLWLFATPYRTAPTPVLAGPFPRFGVFPDPANRRRVRWFY